MNDKTTRQKLLRILMITVLFIFLCSFQQHFSHIQLFIQGAQLSISLINAGMDIPSSLRYFILKEKENQLKMKAPT